jgi:hypothetical protein
MLPGTVARPCLWSLIETSSGVVSVCLPTIGPLLHMAAKKLGISRSSANVPSRIPQTKPFVRSNDRSIALDKSGTGSISVV